MDFLFGSLPCYVTATAATISSLTPVTLEFKLDYTIYEYNSSQLHLHTEIYLQNRVTLHIFTHFTKSILIFLSKIKSK